MHLSSLFGSSPCCSLYMLCLVPSVPLTTPASTVTVCVCVFVCVCVYVCVCVRMERKGKFKEWRREGEGQTCPTFLRSCSQSVLWAVWNIFTTSWSAVKDFPAPLNPLYNKHGSINDQVIQSGCFSVGSCINGKASSLIPTLRSENLSTECFNFCPDDDQSIQSKCQQRFLISKLASENSLFHLSKSFPACLDHIFHTPGSARPHGL